MISIPSTTPMVDNAGYLRSFCNQLVTDTRPIYVLNQPIKTSSAGNCFNNVKQHVSLQGGSIQFGWCLWETPSIILQAEFHAIWISPSGIRIDITPHAQKLKNQHILFLPDPLRNYEGSRINNQRIALLDDSAVHNYLVAQDALFAQTQHYMNDQREKLDTNQQRQDAVDEVHFVLKQFENAHLALERLIKNRFPRNDPCPCGSGLKTKKCCFP